MALALAACDGEGTTVGPEGGTVRSADGRLALEIPAGALEEEVAIAIEVSDAAAVDGAMEAFELEPYGLVFRRPARLTLELDMPEGVEKLERFTNSDLELVTEREEDWVKLADHEVDWETGTVSASVLYLSSYALLQDA